MGLALAAGAPGAAAQGFRESARSRAAIARVMPRLEADLRAEGLRAGAPIIIRIFKFDAPADDDHEGDDSGVLELWVDAGERFQRFRSYPVCSWSGLPGPKLARGDGQSPEGFYFVSAGRMNPSSSYHLSFDLGYPNRYDLAHDRTGSALMVHGNCVSIGCYAMRDDPIEEIWALADAALRAGQPLFRVHIFPFRLTEENLERVRASRWIDFWRNLAEGYAWFERTGRPPDIGVREGRYVFSE